MPDSTPETARPRANLVAGEVDGLLARSAAFQSLPAEAQASLAADLAKTAGFLADKGWLAEPPPARARALKSPDAVDTLKMQLAKKPEQVGKSFKAGALREGVETFGDLVQKVDFPKFVGGLIQNVFQAIVDASIQQMQAYGELLAATAKTVDQFAADHITDNQARDYVSNRYPSAVTVDTTGESPRLQRTEDGEELDLGAEFGVGGADISEPEGEAAFLAGVKLEMARQRQQLLATMVLLGINRIVVTNGHINAKVLFDMRASDTAESRYKASMTDTQKSRASAGTGWATNLVGGFSASTSHETTVSSAVDESSESRASLKAQLSGDVKVSFKSETFPLERMVDVMGLQNLNEKAAPLATRTPSSTSTQSTPAPSPGGAK